MSEEKKIPSFSKNQFKSWVWDRYKCSGVFTNEHRVVALDICEDEWTDQAREKAFEMVAKFMGDVVAENYFFSKRHQEVFNNFMTEMRLPENQGGRDFWDFEDATEDLNGIDDGGERITYGEGMATREPSNGKGRFDLITPFGMRRLARWYELGGHKYSPRNWEKGIPFSRYLDSAMRHLNKFLIGMDDEDHLSAAAWNIFAIIHHQELGQWELDDLPHYKGLGYGAGAPLPEGFEEHWKKHLEELEAKCDKANEEARAAMEAQIEGLKARLKALEFEKEEKVRMEVMLNNMKLEPVYSLPCQGGTT